MDNYYMIEALGRMELKERLRFAERQRLQWSARGATADRAGPHERARDRGELCAENVRVECA